MAYCGGQICFYSGDVLKLKDEIGIVKPTIFPSVPRLYNKFYDAIKKNMDSLTGLKKFLVDRAVKTKLANLANSCSYTHPLFDKLVFNKIRDGFGGRLRTMITGSAPINGEVLDFLKICF